MILWSKAKQIEAADREEAQLLVELRQFINIEKERENAVAEAMRLGSQPAVRHHTYIKRGSWLQDSPLCLQSRGEVDAAGFILDLPGSPIAAELFGGRQPRLNSVFMKSRPGIGSAEPGAASALQRPEFALGIYRPHREDRMFVNKAPVNEFFTGGTAGFSVTKSGVSSGTPCRRFIQ